LVLQRQQKHRFSPIPSTSCSSSIELNPPFSVRYCTIRSASVGPIPSTSSSCSTVALPRLGFTPGVAIASVPAPPLAPCSAPAAGTTIC